MLMLQHAMRGDRRYWTWIAALGVLIATGFTAYAVQLQRGLVVTGMSRDVTWGLYIAQFTFFVGVAASAVMVALPYYIHDFKAFGKVTLIGEFLAVSAVSMCMLFIFVDMGQPARVLNVLRYPSPHSLMFWDMVSLSGYLLLNLIIGLTTLAADERGLPAPSWTKPVIYLSIPWAISIHTVTAFLYSGLAARPMWMTAVLAPRFLASAFASGPALLIIVCLVVRRVTIYDAGDKAISKLTTIMSYGLVISVFLVLVELFTALYSGLPEHADGVAYIYAGLNGARGLVDWSWGSIVLTLIAFVALIGHKIEFRTTALVVACCAVFLALWIEKGMGLIVSGFIPSPLGAIPEYSPTAAEWAIVAGIWAVGALIMTVLCKIAVSVRTL